MARWYDKAVERLEDDLASGEISYDDFRREMRELNEELRAAADEAAEQARKDYYEGW